MGKPDDDFTERCRLRTEELARQREFEAQASREHAEREARFPRRQLNAIRNVAPRSLDAFGLILVVALGAWLALSAPDGSSAGAQAGPRWFEGGTLHRASFGEWAVAAQHNRLATAADMAATLLRRQGRAVASIDELRPFAEELERCVSEAVQEPSLASQRASELGAACAVLLGW